MEISHKPKVPLNATRYSFVLIPLLMLTLSFTGMWFGKVGPFRKSIVQETVNSIAPQTVSWEKRKIELETKPREIKFGESRTEALIGAKAQFYFEGADLETFASGDLTKFIAGIMNLSFAESITYFKDGFTFFCQDGSCGIIFTSKDAEAVNKRVSKNYKTNDGSGFRVAFFENYLLLYKDGALKEKSKEVFERLEKNIGMDSRFLGAFKGIPEKAMAFGYFNGPKEDIKKILIDSFLDFSALKILEIDSQRSSFFVSFEGESWILNY
jgi:hypothetical protein